MSSFLFRELTDVLFPYFFDMESQNKLFKRFLTKHRSFALYTIYMISYMFFLFLSQKSTMLLLNEATATCIQYVKLFRIEN